MNKKQAAEYLGVSDRAVERYTSKGKLSVRYQKGQRGDEAVYDERELKRLRSELDKKRTVVRPAIEATPDTSDAEPRQLARMSDNQLTVTPRAEETARAIAAFNDEQFNKLVSRMRRIARASQPRASSIELSAKHFLTVTEAATLAGLPEHHLRDAIKAGKLKAKTIGRGLKIRPKDLQGYTDKL